MKNLSPFEEIGASSVQGPRSDMQDTYSIQFSRRDRNGIGGRIHIFDGHGEDGGTASRLANDIFTQNINVPAENLEHVFRQADAELLGASIDGGTTATVVDVAINPQGTRTITSLWAGDSPAYLAWPDLDIIGDEHTIYPCTVPLHNIDNQDEVQRMQTAGVHVYGRHFGSIAISRALGDSTRYRGVIPDPEMTEFHSKNNRLLVVGSDGVLTSENTIDVLSDVLKLSRIGSLQKAAEYITRKYAEENHDNATVVLANLPKLP